uniref:Crystallin zeta like 1 n=1 Tax=Taeniopygia guttata TaxID=59729 RepID=A0A674HBF1_TAEGU
MKALYGQQNSPGEEMTFVLQERENLPACRDHDVKVQVRACALSWVDTKLLSEIKLKKELVPVGREISGVVLEVGSKVTFFQPDDEVVGILPLDSEESGVCEIILVHEHYLVHKPEKVCWAEAAGTVRDGLRAYTALHYLAQVSPGTSVLVLDGASPFGTIAIQLAQHRGAKVISTAHSLEDKQYLERLRPAGGVRQPLSSWIPILEDIMEKLSNRIFRPQLDEPIPLYEAKVSMEIVQKNQARKRQVIQF